MEGRLFALDCDRVEGGRLTMPLGQRVALIGGGHNALVAAFYLAKDRKSTRLNSSHTVISYAVFCLKKKNIRDVAAPGSRTALHAADFHSHQRAALPERDVRRDTADGRDSGRGECATCLRQLVEFRA